MAAVRRSSPFAVLALLASLVGCGSSAKPVAPGHPAESGGATPAAARPRALPGGHRAPREAVPILMYHVIGYRKPGTAYPELWVRPAEFRAEIRALAGRGYHGVTLRQVWDAWHRGGELPSRPLVVSFDDGYYGQYRDALPALRALGWPGVLNLKLGNLNDMGGRRTIRAMVAAGWEVDDHTITHPDLRTLSDAQLHREVAGSRAMLHRISGAPVDFFCYPAGRYDARVVAAVRAAGYLAATSTRFGFARPQDGFTLARVRVDGSDGPDGVVRKVAQLAAHPDAPATPGGATG